MDPFEYAAKRSKEAGGNFVSMKNDGDKVVGVFCGAPHVEEQIWNEKEQKNEPYTEAHKAKGLSPSPKFKMNFFTEGQMKIISMNNQTFKLFMECRAKYTLEKCFFEIKRNGAAKNTKTTYTILPDRDLTEADRKLIAACALHDLKAAGDGEDDDMHSHDKANEKPGDVLIDSATKDAMVARLKPLPREKVTEYLKGLGVSKMGDIRSSMVPQAMAALAALEASLAPAAAPPAAEIDPFA